MFEKIKNIRLDNINDVCVIFNVEGSETDFLEWIKRDGKVERTDSHLKINQDDELQKLLNLDIYRSEVDLEGVHDYLDAEIAKL
jgi:hypothetical protein